MFERKRIEQPAQFIQRLSMLLQEGYSLQQCMHILAPFHFTQAISVQLVEQLFLKGHSFSEVLHIIGIHRRFLLPITIAETTGDLAVNLAKVADEMLFHTRMMKQLRKLIVYPTCLFVFLGSLFFAYQRFFLPKMTMITQMRGAEQHSASYFMYAPQYFFVLCIGGLAVVVASLFYIRKKEPHVQKAWIEKIPFIGSLFVLVVTKQFARELGQLLLHGFPLQMALQRLAEQKQNRYVQVVAQQLWQQIVRGESLSAAVQNYEKLHPKFVGFIVQGEHSGTLGRELLIFYDLLQEKWESILASTMKTVQPTLLAIVAICVLAAYLSILLPIYQLIEFV